MKRKHPTAELAKDLAAVFQKHNWSGAPIGISSSPANLMANAKDDIDDGSCPDGSEPQWVTYKLPDGTWVTKKMCV